MTNHTQSEPTTTRPALACLRCGFGARCTTHGQDFRQCIASCVYVPSGDWRARSADVLPKTCARCHSHEWQVPWTGRGRKPSDPPNPRWEAERKAAATRRQIRETTREHMLRLIEEAERAQDHSSPVQPDSHAQDVVNKVSESGYRHTPERLQARLEHGIPPPPRIQMPRRVEEDITTEVVTVVPTESSEEPDV